MNNLDSSLISQTEFLAELERMRHIAHCGICTVIPATIILSKPRRKTDMNMKSAAVFQIVVSTL